MSYNYSLVKKSKNKSSKKNKLFIKPPAKNTYPTSVDKHMKRYGLSHNHYQYRNIKGETCFWVIRYEPGELNGNSKKVLVPMSFCKATNTWEKGSWPKDRPLFQENFLKNAADGDEVVIVEGEKAVQALTKLKKFKHIVTWSGGSNAVHQTDFTALRNKKIILWPDNDEEGFKSMQHVGKILIDNEITEDINWIKPLKELPTGWDVADLVVRDESWPIEALQNATREVIDKMIKAQEEFIPNKETWDEIDAQYVERELKEKVTEFNKNYVYVRDRKEFFEINTYKFLDKNQVNDWYRHLTKNMADQLLKNPELIKVHSYLTHAALPSGVVDIKQNQIAGVAPGRYLNNFKGSTVEAIEATAAVDKENLGRILGYFNWLLPNWQTVSQIIAYIIKFPGQKIKWATLIVSKTEGVGKGLLAQLIQGMLGADNVEINVSHSQMTNKHSTIIEGKQLIILNEVLISGTGLEKKEITNKMKSLFTDATIVIEPKGKPQITIPNFCNFIIFSNDEGCMHLNNESRRYFVDFIERTAEEIMKMLEESGVKDLILAALDGDGIKHLKYHFMNNVEIEDTKIFHQRAPVTKSMLEMVDKSRPEAIRLLDTALKDNMPPFKNFYPDYQDGANTVDLNAPEIWIRDQNDAQRSIPQFSGMVIRDEFYEFLKGHKKYQNLFLNLDILEDWIKEKAIPWPNGELTKQIVFKDSSEQVSSRPRAYLIKDLKFPAQMMPKQMSEAGVQNYARVRLSEMTAGQLGAVHQTLSYGVVGRNTFNTLYKGYYENVNDQSDNKDESLKVSEY